MKTKIHYFITAFILFAAFSCTKQSGIKVIPAAQQTNTVQKTVPPLSIGQSYHGGIIFYIDNTGQHGLIAATSDQGTGIPWRNHHNVLTGANGNGIYDGATNTATIVSALGNSGGYAALICSNYSVGNFHDWYLPSKAELNQMYIHRSVVPGLAATNYWSSSEVNKPKAWDQEFGGGFQFKDEKTFTLNVRAVSYF